jgi:hypothetical protein
MAEGAVMGRDVPVAVLLAGVLGEEVRSFSETELGWQVVAGGAGLRPVLALASAPVPDLPWVLVVEGEPSAEMVRGALRSGALDVVGWPQDRERLHALPDGLRSDAGGGARLFSVAGGAGGVGTSTVTLGVAALLAAAGRRTTVVGGDDLLTLCGLAPWRGPGSLDVAALEPSGIAEEVRLLSRPVPGVPRLRVLGGGAVTDAAGWPGDVVVVDAGTARSATVQLLCARPDAHLPGAAAAGAPVLVAGDGPVTRAGVRRILGSNLAGTVPWSHRVARAGAAGRIPSALPGTWVRDLRTAMRGLR